jgi:hypothetical protein
MSYLVEEVNCTESSPSISVPWVLELGCDLLLMLLTLIKTSTATELESLELMCRRTVTTSIPPRVCLWPYSQISAENTLAYFCSSLSDVEIKLYKIATRVGCCNVGMVTSKFLFLTNWGKIGFLPGRQMHIRARVSITNLCADIDC